jgi:hypothetical protein
MRHSMFVVFLMLAGADRFVPASPAREFLTEKEITSIQEAQTIDARTYLYMEAAELRLKTAGDRFAGKESQEGDPLEFFTPGDLVDAYYRILQSVMTNLDAAFQDRRDPLAIGKALKTLKKSTEKTARQLEALKKLAEEKKNEELWNLVIKAIDITGGAHKGAEEGLAKVPAPPEKNPKKK